MPTPHLHFKIHLSWWRERKNIVFAAILTALPFFLLYPLLNQSEVGIWVIGALLAIAAVYWLTIIYRHQRSYLLQNESQLTYRVQLGLVKNRIVSIDWSLVSQLEMKKQRLGGYGDLIITTDRQKQTVLTTIPKINYIFNLLQQHLNKQKSASHIVEHLKRKLGEDKFAELIADLDENML